MLQNSKWPFYTFFDFDFLQNIKKHTLLQLSVKGHDTWLTDNFEPI